MKKETTINLFIQKNKTNKKITSFVLSQRKKVRKKERCIPSNRKKECAFI